MPDRERLHARKGAEPQLYELLDPENVKSRFAAETFAYIGELIRFADEKAAFFFSASAAILYLMFKDGVEKHLLFSLEHLPVRPIFGLLAMAASAIACALGLGVITPRRRGGASGQIFFAAIAQIASREAYADAVMSRGDDELIREKLLHCHDLSLICTRKYRILKWELRTLTIGLILAVVYYLAS